MKSLKKISNDFLFHCRIEKNLSPHSLKAYELDLKQFTGYLKVHGYALEIEKIDKQVLRDYLSHLNTSCKIKTIKRKIATLKSLFNFVEFEDIISINPFRKMRIKIKEPLRLPNVLSLDEIKMLFRFVYKERQSCCDSNSYEYKSITRDIVILELLFATGVRVSELCNLEKSDVSIEQRYIKVHGKGSRERLIQVCNAEIIIILKEYVELYHEEGEEFPYFFSNRLGKRLSEQSVRFMIERYIKHSGIKKKVTPHTFRHTFATLLLEENVDIRYIQQLLGHSTISTTQIYTHITQQKQKEILFSHHPRESFQLM